MNNNSKLFTEYQNPSRDGAFSSIVISHQSRSNNETTFQRPDKKPTNILHTHYGLEYWPTYARAKQQKHIPLELTSSNRDSVSKARETRLVTGANTNIFNSNELMKVKQGRRATVALKM